MMKVRRIVTVGLAPAWDITCRGANLRWGLHRQIDGQTVRPAGKALNVSNALAWMGHKSTAMGLWGCQDYQQMKASMQQMASPVQIKMTVVPGRTRQNITVVDTARGKEMHLRSESSLASHAAMRQLKADLEKTVHKDDICVFAGAMPSGALLADCIGAVEPCRAAGAQIAVDTYGPALTKLVSQGWSWLIKPNVEELRELLNLRVKDDGACLAQAVVRHSVLDKVPVLLVSRGAKGAVLITRHGLWVGTVSGRSATGGCGGGATVGCGDYLLAGFLKGLADGEDMPHALNLGLTAATAHAWGWTQTKTWSAVKRCVRPAVRPLRCPPVAD